MTQNQIRYWEYLEGKRHNVESESAQTKQAEAAMKNADTNFQEFELHTQTEPLKAMGSYIGAQASKQQADTASYLAPSTYALNLGKYYDTTAGTLDYFAGVQPQSNAIVNYTHSLIDQATGKGSGKVKVDKPSTITQPYQYPIVNKVAKTYQQTPAYKDKIRDRKSGIINTFLQY